MVVIASLSVEDVVFPVSCVLLLLLLHVWEEILVSGPGNVRRCLLFIASTNVYRTGENNYP